LKNFLPCSTLTALIAAAASWVFLFLRRRSGALAVGELVILGVLVGFLVFTWRLVGNIAPLNNDLIPPFSPGDVLCTMITYVLFGIYATFRPLQIWHNGKRRAPGSRWFHWL